MPIIGPQSENLPTPCLFSPLDNWGRERGYDCGWRKWRTWWFDFKQRWGLWWRVLERWCSCPDAIGRLAVLHHQDQQLYHLNCRRQVVIWTFSANTFLIMSLSSLHKNVSTSLYKEIIYLQIVSKYILLVLLQFVVYLAPQALAELKARWVMNSEQTKLHHNPQQM